MLNNILIKNNNLIYYILINEKVNKKIISDLENILEGKQTFSLSGYILLGPKLHINTPLCTNIIDILKSININYVTKIELFKIIPKIINYDPTINSIYSNRINSNIKLKKIKNKQLKIEDIKNHFDEAESEYYINYYNNNKSNPTYLEMFDLIQSNSEHCRHWFFRGTFVQKNNVLLSPMDLIKDTLNHCFKNSIIAFSDNSSVIKGFDVVNSVINKYIHKKVFMLTHPVLTAETHNFPTGISPFHGAATGVGGRMRDNMATGQGSIPMASLAGYSIGNINYKYNSYFADPLNILIQASNGASDYGNKVGEPIIGGYTTSYSDINYAYVKPIMFSAGLSKIYDCHIKKEDPSPNDNIVLFGGPAYKIGIGGGHASSTSQSGLNLQAVQRGDPYIQNKLKHSLVRCIELFGCSPIKSIHDQGAGGIANVTKELCEPLGAEIHLDRMKQAQKDMTSIEIYCSEFQESNAILCSDTDLPILKFICEEEGTDVNVLGKVSYDNIFKVYHNNKIQGQFDLKYLNDNSLYKKYYLKSFNFKEYNDVLNTSDLDLEKEIKNVFSHVSCCSKRFLTNKVDRSVTGLVARQQCVGPYHMPISDFSALAFSAFSCKGFASSIGENYIYSILKPTELPKYAVGEMLTNLIGSNFIDFNQIKFSANWMWPKGLDDQSERLYVAIKELHKICKQLQIGIDGGKDSLSMYTKHNNRVIKSPGTLICTSYVPVRNVYNLVNPYFQKTNSYIFLLCPSNKYRLGGSLFYHNHNIYNSNVPTIDCPEHFRRCCIKLNQLCKENKIISIHDIGKGGMFLHLVEMCLGNNIGANIDSNGTLYPFIFHEELGWIIETNSFDILQDLNVVFLGKTTENKSITINKTITFTLDKLRQMYEKTSLELEKHQTKSHCVKQEKEFLEHSEKFKYKINFQFCNSKNTNLKVAIIREQGSNSDREMCDAFKCANFIVYNYPMNKLLLNPELIVDMDGLVFVGGFSFGDAIKSAKGWALRIKNNFRLYQILKIFFMSSKKFTLGVCNGCQLLVELGLFGYAKLVKNDSNRFESRYIYLKIKQDNIFFKNMKESILGCWVAHGEGKFVNVDKKYICATYTDLKQQDTVHYPENPNGSQYGCAALYRREGNVLAIMPHPERSYLQYQLPYRPDNVKNWNKTYGPWFKIFQNLAIVE